MAYDTDIRLAGLQSDLDTNLNATVSSRLGAIAGIDRGTITASGSTTATATVTAVETSRSILHNLGMRFATDGANFHQAASLALTNSTTITADFGVDMGGAGPVSYQLVEYAA